MSESIKCYISGRPLAAGDKAGTISFAVPDYGILFRCRGEGTRTELEIIAFMSLLRFAEANSELFRGRELLIHTDFPFIVYLLNNGLPSGSAGATLEAVAAKARQHAKEFTFRVQWVDGRDNRAAGSIGDLPDLPDESGRRLKSSLLSPDPLQPPRRPTQPKSNLF